jgi:hypothetical protein
MSGNGYPISQGGPEVHLPPKPRRAGHARLRSSCAHPWSRWDLVARATLRKVYRLIPHADENLIVGRANRGGNFDLIEAVKPGPPAPIAEIGSGRLVIGSIRVAVF